MRIGKKYKVPTMKKDIEKMRKTTKISEPVATLKKVGPLKKKPAPHSPAPTKLRAKRKVKAPVPVFDKRKKDDGKPGDPLPSEFSMLARPVDSESDEKSPNYE